MHSVSLRYMAHTVGWSFRIKDWQLLACCGISRAFLEWAIIITCISMYILLKTHIVFSQMVISKAHTGDTTCSCILTSYYSQHITYSLYNVAKSAATNSFINFSTLTLHWTHSLLIRFRQSSTWLTNRVVIPFNHTITRSTTCGYITEWRLHLGAELLFGGDVFGLVGLGLSLKVGAQVATMLVHRRRRVLASGERDDPRVHQHVDGRVASLPVND